SLDRHSAHLTGTNARLPADGDSRQHARVAAAAGHRGAVSLLHALQRAGYRSGRARLASCNGSARLFRFQRRFAMADQNPSILSHVSLGSNRFGAAAAFYDAVLTTLGCTRIM